MIFTHEDHVNVCHLHSFTPILCCFPPLLHWHCYNSLSVCLSDPAPPPHPLLFWRHFIPFCLLSPASGFSLTIPSSTFLNSCFAKAQVLPSIFLRMPSMAFHILERIKRKKKLQFPQEILQPCHAAHSSPHTLCTFMFLALCCSPLAKSFSFFFVLLSSSSHDIYRRCFVVYKAPLGK